MTKPTIGRLSIKMEMLTNVTLAAALLLALTANSSAQLAVDSASKQYESSEELAPAAIELDVSHTSPLLQLLYAATRETKQQPTLVT